MTISDMPYTAYNWRTCAMWTPGERFRCRRARLNYLNGRDRKVQFYPRRAPR